MIDRVEIAGRRWYREPNGTLRPSASSVLDILFPMNKSFIPEEALAMGTLCHDETSKALLTLVNKEVYDEHSDEKVNKRVRAAITWLSGSGLEIHGIESSIVFLGVGMTPDLLGRKHGGGAHIVDWKFAEAMAERYYYQMEIYMRAEEATDATIVRIDRQGDPYPVRVVRDDERWEMIKSAMNVRFHLDRREKRHLHSV